MRNLIPRPSASDCKVTSFRFGRNRRRVLFLAWLTLLPTIGPLPVSSHTRDIGLSSSSAYRVSPVSRRSSGRARPMGSRCRISFAGFRGNRRPGQPAMGVIQRASRDEDDPASVPLRRLGPARPLSRHRQAAPSVRAHLPRPIGQATPPARLVRTNTLLDQRAYHRKNPHPAAIPPAFACRPRPPRSRHLARPRPSSPWETLLGPGAVCAASAAHPHNPRRCGWRQA
mmetsp:Transcript_32492/g.62594  ORF Transcript_32492/g.62594 Transcript_32492/m.62594 type:complete len:227 (-) Transcript_32492:567-1247(-)